MTGLRALPRLGALLAAVAVLAGVLLLDSSADAGHEPADKVAAAGSTLEIGAPGERIVLLSETIRSSAPSDLILSATLECSIITDVVTVGDDAQSAEGKIRAWIEIDGQPVPVSSDDTGGGKVTFCNRIYSRTTQLGEDDQEDTHRTYMATKTANAFNWMTFNVGAGLHTVELVAELSTNSTEGSLAEAYVGNRTLVIEPVKASNHEEI